MSRDNTHADEEAPNPWTQRGFVASAVVVALIAVLGLFLAFAGPSGGNGNAAPRAITPTTTTSPSAGSNTPPASDSACGLPAGDQAVPRTAPKNTNWELVGTMAAPTAPDTHGPGRVDDGLRSCYAHSPTGALYAAANFVAATTVPDRREAAVRELAAEGPGRNAALAAIKREGEQRADGSGTQIAGFTFLNYGSETSVVDLAFRTSSGAFAHMPMSLRWQNGDWKVVFPDDGDLGHTIKPLPDLTGYARWGGA